MGDDLGSDDEYLRELVTETSSPTANDRSSHSAKTETGSGSKKRNRSNSEDSGSHDGINATKRPFTKVLFESSRNLERESAETQCAFLSTALMHNLSKVEGDAVVLPKLFPHYFRTSTKDSLASRLSDVLSTKKLKHWNQVGSPMVVIICISARRAVAVLKELAFLKVRAAKLFAKHMEVDQQRTLLRNAPFGLAVGTPHRILALCQPSDDNPKEQPALRMDASQLVVLDSHVNPKGFTVCSLPDTAPTCMELLRHHVLPLLANRKDLKLAFF